MQIRRIVIGLALTTAVAGGLTATTAATSPDIYYDLSPATHNNPASGATDQGSATVSASPEAAPGIYYDL